VVVALFAAKHGPMPGNGAMVLGMGSLGAERLNSASDLDQIVIYDADGVEFSEGRRPLASRTYYSRLTQAMVTAVTAQMSQGRLYEIDMRLRPSGTQGPVATSITSFRDYQMNQAWTWEHLALTRARPVAGEAALMQEIEIFRQEVLQAKSTGDAILKDVDEMRERIAAAKQPSGLWDAKLGSGRMQDIELVAQAATLMAGSAKRDIAAGLANGVAIGWFDAAESAALKEAYDLCWTLQVASKLLTEHALDPANIGEGGCAMLLRETGSETIDDLLLRLGEVTWRAAEVIDTILNRAPSRAGGSDEG
jgi:glutamate-ammonia-ligase adenylyltransferase